MSYGVTAPVKRGLSLGSAYFIWVSWLVISVSIITALGFLTPVLSGISELFLSFGQDMTKAVMLFAVLIYLILSIFTFWFPLLAIGSNGRKWVYLACLTATTIITGAVIFLTFEDFSSVIGLGATLGTNPFFIGFPYFTVLAIYLVGQCIFWPRSAKRKA